VDGRSCHLASSRWQQAGLQGPRNFLLGLFVAAHRGANRTALQSEQLESIRHAVGAEEPGGGHMVELVQVMLAASEATCSPELAAEYDRCEGCIES